MPNPKLKKSTLVDKKSRGRVTDQNYNTDAAPFQKKKTPKGDLPTEATPSLSWDDQIKAARVNNPGLHLLYVGWGVKHILAINKALADLSALSNLNLTDAQLALAKERDKLITTEPAYHDADEILDQIMKSLPKRLRYTTQVQVRESKRNQDEKTEVGAQS